MAAPRYRTYVGIGYPESLVENWIEKLEEYKVPILISPLHNPEPDQKKQHYHIMLYFSGVQPVRVAEEIFASIKAVILPERVYDTRAMARYFCHLDEDPKEKEHYSESEVTCLSGFDYMTIINLPADKYSAISEMIDFVIEYNIISFAQLVLYAKQNQERWYRSLCDNSTLFMKEFIKSYFWEQKELAKNN